MGTRIAKVVIPARESSRIVASTKGVLT